MVASGRPNVRAMSRSNITTCSPLPMAGLRIDHLEDILREVFPSILEPRTIADVEMLPSACIAELIDAFIGDMPTRSFEQIPQMPPESDEQIQRNRVTHCKHRVECPVGAPIPFRDKPAFWDSADKIHGAPRRD